MAGLTIADVIARAARVHADRPAIVDGDVRLTYREYADRVARAAGVLSDLGVRHGGRVATLMQNGVRYLDAYFAIPGIGAVMVPLNGRLAPAEMREILVDAEVDLLIVDDVHATVGEALSDAVGQVLKGDAAYDELLATSAPRTLGDGVDEDDLAALFYTGGTTGRPKGVMMSHRSMLANAMNLGVLFKAVDDECYLHAGPMFHLGDGASTYVTTLGGGRHAFVPSFEPAAVLEAIERDRVTTANGVPIMLQALIRHPDVAKRDLSSLRRFTHGSAPIAPSLLEEAIDVLGCDFHQAYGMTEACGCVTALMDEQNLVGDPALASAGRPVAGLLVEIIRPDGTLCEVGEVGEIRVKGPNVMVGYWRAEEQTEAVLRDGWYHTGDLAHHDQDWNVFLVDRAKDMIVTGAENVYSVEVENALASHPAVLQVAVIGVPHDTWGEAVHAEVVLIPGAEATEADLIAHCRGRIAGFKTPKSIAFRDAMPVSGAGKIQKRALREAFWSGRERHVN